MKRISLLLSGIVLSASAATPGFVKVSVDSVPGIAYLDAVTVELTSGPVVVEASPGKHFVSLFSPAKVYKAASREAPEYFWDRLRAAGAIGDRPGLLASYEAGSVRAGTEWVYVTPDETVQVRLSSAEVAKVYRRDSGCATRTFLGWTLLVGVAMVMSVVLAAIGT